MNMSKGDDAKQIMIDKCRLHYNGNPTYLRWYTKTGFIYRLVNQALRTEDIEALLALRFYITDLCECLTREYINNREYFSGITITLYRRLTLDDNQID
ncbi:unnamed protein product, partial [Rotaria sordida]